MHYWIVVLAWPLLAFQCNYHGKEYPVVEAERNKFVRKWNFTRLDSATLYPPYEIEIIPRAANGYPAVTILNLLLGEDSVQGTLYQDPFETGFDTRKYIPGETFYHGTMRFDGNGPRLNTHIEIRQMSAATGEDTLLYEFQGIAE